MKYGQKSHELTMSAKCSVALKKRVKKVKSFLPPSLWFKGKFLMFSLYILCNTNDHRGDLNIDRGPLHDYRSSRSLYGLLLTKECNH